MRKNNNNNNNTCSSEESRGVMTVKTIYARIAVGLLALNFLLTGYVVTRLNSTVQEQLDSASGVSQTKAPATLSAERANPVPEVESRESDPSRTRNQ